MASEKLGVSLTHQWPASPQRATGVVQCSLIIFHYACIPGDHSCIFKLMVRSRFPGKKQRRDFRPLLALTPADSIAVHHATQTVSPADAGALALPTLWSWLWAAGDSLPHWQHQGVHFSSCLWQERRWGVQHSPLPPLTPLLCQPSWY